MVHCGIWDWCIVEFEQVVYRFDMCWQHKSYLLSYHSARGFGLYMYIVYLHDFVISVSILEQSDSKRYSFIDHCSDLITSSMASQITGVTIVCSLLG